MRYILFIVIVFCNSFFAKAQTELMEKLKARYDIKNGYETMVNISIDVPGLTVSPKDLSIKYEKGKKVQIKGKGILLIPKKGLTNQFSELLSSQAHWIFLSDNGGFVNYKLVSMDSKSDWVTADLKILKEQSRIDEIDLITKDSGEYLIKHSYSSGNFPSTTEISFWTSKLNIPLKFLGKTSLNKAKDKDGKIKGKIFLKFSGFHFL
ncbi:hypothetical protein [Flavobacterium granuli]|uniref:Outer membrane lipoprotein-sorting protein n=1 Tax=Flavobacterium granuli TaxID=280093 RepID=A0ABU1S0T9_9FLAO|nr:hypothetical protein [Flavobacterium granuli]MDR6844641.1 hypothetical protein [Flavobacterium granuli]